MFCKGDIFLPSSWRTSFADSKTSGSDDSRPLIIWINESVSLRIFGFSGFATGLIDGIRFNTARNSRAVCHLLIGMKFTKWSAKSLFGGIIRWEGCVYLKKWMISNLHRDSVSTFKNRFVSSEKTLLMNSGFEECKKKSIISIGWTPLFA